MATAGVNYAPPRRHPQIPVSTNGAPFGDRAAGARKDPAVRAGPTRRIGEKEPV